MALTNPLIEEVRQALSRFQDGYTRRDSSTIDEYMSLFTQSDALEMIGTNGIRPGVEEWYRGTEKTRDMIKGDWASWGQVQLDVENANIRALNEVAWVSATGTVTMQIPAKDNYEGFLQFIKSVVDEPGTTAEEKLLYILRGGTNTLYELHRGEQFIWPLRFTAVLVRESAGWKFHQVQFSLPTIFFPDVREVK